MTNAPYITVSTAEMYDSVADLVKKIVWKFLKKYGGEWDEWMSDANLAAVRAINSYDNSRGAKLSTWVHNCVYFDLITSVQNRIRHADRNEVQLVFDPPKSDALSRFRMIMSDVSEDAQVLLGCFLEADATQRVNTVRRLVREQLKSAGWSSRRLTQVLDEVQAILTESV